MPPSWVMKMTRDAGCGRMDLGQDCRCSDDERFAGIRPEFQPDRFAAVGALGLADLIIGPLPAATIRHHDQ